MNYNIADWAIFAVTFLVFYAIGFGLMQWVLNRTRR